MRLAIFALTTCCFSILCISSLPAQSHLNFDGFGDHVQLNGSDFQPPWTVECWVSKNEIAQFQHLLTSTDGTSGIRIEQYINTAKIGITKKGVADWQFNASLETGVWTHLAVTNSGSQMRLFLNGQPFGTINGTIDAPLGMVGLNTTGAGALNAKIDELRYWKTVVSQADLTTWMTKNLDASHPDFQKLEHYYKFDEGSGTVANDEKGTLPGTVLGAQFCPVFQKDLAAAAVVNPSGFVAQFSQNEQVTVRISNDGVDPIAEEITVKYALDGGPEVSQTFNSASNPIPQFGFREVSFPAVDMSGAGIHTVLATVSVAGDLSAANDTFFATSSLAEISLGDISGFENPSPGEFLISSGVSKVKITFYEEVGGSIFRIRLAPNGIFQDPTNGEIAIFDGIFGEEPFQNAVWSEELQFYKMETGTVELRAYKSPLRFMAIRSNDGKVLFEESQPLSFGQKTKQRLKRGEGEQFFGCGMQNGYFSHRDRAVKIENAYGNWGDGDVSNPAPFFFNSNWCGVFRNTWSKGLYNFAQPVDCQHDENRFDAFYFAGNSPKNVIDFYTRITGRPFMMPRWGLYFGDADCYNDTGTTADVIEQIAKKYREKDMPGGWILPNDGYGCGYEKLDSVARELDTLGFHTGLWSESALSKIDWEVGQADVRVYKLDVALVGPGYRTAAELGKAAFNGIENHSASRGYVWTVGGWAGTQRFATLWSGDQSGNWENVRFHIPTVIGAGLSGFNASTGDVDGIFGGSASTYARDIAWKSLLLPEMVISGWASVGKQPWAYGNIANISRKYLKLKSRLTPYLYTLAWEANYIGWPSARAMLLEFPEDTVTWDKTTQYQFMCGENLLVAPVYQAGLTRSGIYLPAGRWTDYWDGKFYDGPQVLNNYSAPLDKLPMFVREGSIIPMQPEMLFDGEKPANPLTIDVYPTANYSEGRLYEDDGFSKEFRDAAYTYTSISCSAPAPDFSQPVVVEVKPIDDFDFVGKLAARDWHFQVHSFGKRPGIVKIGGIASPEFSTKTDWENAQTPGWFFDAADRRGIVFVKTLNVASGSSIKVELLDFTSSNVEPDAFPNLKISPNPASSEVLISGIDPTVVERIRLFNSLNTNVLEVDFEVLSEVLVPVSGLACGVWFLEVFGDGKRGVRRVVVLK